MSVRRMRVRCMSVRCEVATAIDKDFAGIGMLEQAGDVQQRRFAGAGRPHQRHRLAGPDRELDALENVERGVALPETPRYPCRSTIGRASPAAVDGADSMLVVISSIACGHSYRKASTGSSRAARHDG